MRFKISVMLIMLLLLLNSTVVFAEDSISEKIIESIEKYDSNRIIIDDKSSILDTYNAIVNLNKESNYKLQVDNIYKKNNQTIIFAKYEKLNNANNNFQKRDYYDERNNLELKAVSQAIKKGEENVDISGLSSDEFYSLLDRLSMNFEYSSYINSMTMITNGSSQTLELSYTKDSQKVSEEISEIEFLANQFIENNNLKNKTDREKLVMVFNFILDEVEYLRDYNPETYEYKPFAHTPHGVFFEKEVVCEGYAKTLQLFLNKLDIPNYVISGYGLEERHAWNIVLLEDKWYHIDATWSDTSIEDTIESMNLTSETIKQYVDAELRYSYFLKTDKEMKVEHTWEKKDGFPNAITKNDFILNEIKREYHSQSEMLTIENKEDFKDMFKQGLMKGYEVAFVFEYNSDKIPYSSYFFDEMEAVYLDGAYEGKYNDVKSMKINYIDITERKTIYIASFLN